MKPVRWAVFASGNGTNLQNFLDIEDRLKKQELIAVYADRECMAIDRARRAGKEIFVLDPNREGATTQILQFLKSLKINSIFLLGYMRLLKPDFLDDWTFPILNLHPSLLPKHKGLNAIKKAYDAGDTQVGVSIHLVTVDLDSGPLIRQTALERRQGESLEELEKRIHELEYEIVRELLFDLESSPLDSIV